MTTSHTDFYSNINGALTPEQAIQALSLEAQGDTGTQPDTGGAPATTTATDTSTEGNDPKDQGQAKAAAATNGAASIPEDQMTAENTVILARDGKHTIGFEQLDKARQQRDEFKAQAEASQRELAQALVDAGQAPTKTDNMAATAAAAIAAGEDASLFGDFSEEALAKGIEKLVDQRVEARVTKALEPLTTKQEKDAAASHYEAIYGKHPDADSIAQSNEFKAWVNAQPSAVRNAYWGLFDAQTGGTANEIVEVFDVFKAASAKPVTTAAATPKEAARAAAASATAEPPSSLSSIPGGRASGASALDATADMSGLEMLQATESMSPAQIEAWLNKQI